MEKTILSGEWHGRCIMAEGGFDFVATVPGSSISDLIACGKLPQDIFYRDNADKVPDFESCDFSYEREFSVRLDPNRIYRLCFDKLDTYATILLNGQVIARTQNAFIEYAFDVTDVLVDGTNTLRVELVSPVTAVKDMPLWEGAFTLERMNTRRIQCTYGWDWVARFISCGITGDVTLTAEEVGEMRITSAYIHTENIDGNSAGMLIDLCFTPDSRGGLVTLSILSPEGKTVRQVQRYCNETPVRVRLDIPHARLWYPHGYGDQPLYTLVVTRGDELLHREVFGIRTVKILQLPDEVGSEAYEKCRAIQNPYFDQNDVYSGFILKVNGKRIFCHGANYVPCVPFACGDVSEKQTEMLLRARDCGVNMLRVWGGGDFETPHFYDECSRLGIMVTQDFLMACGTYPENEDWFIRELNAEAACAALRIRNKPCLMWWSGDNENGADGNDLMESYKGRRAAYDGVAKVLYELDPYRPFLSSSPYGGKQYASNTVGTTHNTQFLGQMIFPYMLKGECADYREYYKKFRARFIAEEPQMGAVSEGTARRFMTEEDIYDGEEMWQYHMKSNPGLQDSLFDMTVSFAEGLFGRFTSGKDRFFKLRYLQYEWIRLSMEQARRELWFSSGVIFWMWNDCWPASAGWSIIDYYNKPKDAYYAFKRCAKPLVLSIDFEDGEYRVCASNLGDAVQGARLTVSAVRGEQVRSLWTQSVDLQAEGVTVVGRFPNGTLLDGETMIAEIMADGSDDRTYYRHGAPMLVPTEKIDYEWHAEGNSVTVTARDSYVHAVELEANAVFSDNCFSLLPHETRTIFYEPLGAVDAITVTSYTFDLT